jgi:hypothetical protein
MPGKQVAHPRLLDAIFKKAPESRSAAERELPLPFDAHTEDQAADEPDEPF